MSSHPSTPPEPDSDIDVDGVSSPPTAAVGATSTSRTERNQPSLRSTVALVTAVTGLVSAIAAFTHVPEEKTAKEGYVVLQKAFNEQQTEIEGLKKDVLSVRSSLEEYVRAKEGDSNVIPAVSPSDTVASVAVRVGPSPSAIPATAAGWSPARVVVIPPARPPTSQRPLPDVHEIEAKANGKN